MKINESNAESLSWNRLLEALRDFDESTGPFGLYAAGEINGPPERPGRMHFELDRVLKPALRELGWLVNGKPIFGPNSLIADFRSGQRYGVVRVVRVSKIKVRRYGNAFRTDPNLDFADRWKAVDLWNQLNALRRTYGYEVALLLFIGFSAERCPFRDELEELEAAKSYRDRFAPSESATWTDPHNRCFQTRAVLWQVETLRRRAVKA